MKDYQTPEWRRQARRNDREICLIMAGNLLTLVRYSPWILWFKLTGQM